MSNVEPFRTENRKITPLEDKQSVGSVKAKKKREEVGIRSESLLLYYY